MKEFPCICTTCRVLIFICQIMIFGSVGACSAYHIGIGQMFIQIAVSCLVWCLSALVLRMVELRK